MAENTITTSCAIAGGGPAGIMLGYLLARAGVDVVVLEKHADFLRDFRGDTIHPSTLEVMHELGLLEALLERPHQKVSEVGLHVGNTRLHLADFSHLPTRCKYVAFMPQWDFLDFLSNAAKRYNNFRLYMKAEVTGLVEEGGRIGGLSGNTPDGELEVLADLVVGADGRGSVVRSAAGLDIMDLSAPIDVLWMRLSRRDTDPAETLGRVDRGHMVILIDRGDYWQCAFVIEKGALNQWKTRGIHAFRDLIAGLLPFMDERVNELRSWDDIKLLTVKLDRLREWGRDGLLCIGDAAHAMSPVGGVGINLAIQDAVAAANILALALRERRLSLEDLRAVQRRRAWPTRITQAVQVQAHKRIITPVLHSSGTMRAPWPLKLLDRFPLLRRIPGRAIGMGAQPEHVRIALK